MDVSLKTYAVHRGVTPRAVREAIESGRLTSASCRRGGRRWHIDPVAADREWDEHTNAGKRRAPAPEPAVPEKGLFGDLEPAPGPRPVDSNGAGGPSLPRAQALKATFQAQRERLKYEREAGELVPRQDVEIEAFRIARDLRDRLLQIPARLRDQLAAEDRPREVERQLQDALTEALQSLGQ